MIQTGDPSGTGKGGQSIWGEYFPVMLLIHHFHIFIYLGFIFRMKLMNI
jgi:hypothetical protein